VAVPLTTREQITPKAAATADRFPSSRLRDCILIESLLCL